jgi:hypothetical protein
MKLTSLSSGVGVSVTLPSGSTPKPSIVRSLSRMSEVVTPAATAMAFSTPSTSAGRTIGSPRGLAALAFGVLAPRDDLAVGEHRQRVPGEAARAARRHGHDLFSGSVTGVGKSLSAFVPSPIWPKRLAPHPSKTPLAPSAKQSAPPAHTAPMLASARWTGVSTSPTISTPSPLVPLPIWPKALPPHVETVPSTCRAMTWPPSPSICLTGPASPSGLTG